MRHHSTICATLLYAVSTPVLAQEATRSLSVVAGDVHLMQNNFHLSLVVPTPDGTIRIDPVNAGAGDR